MAPNLYPVFILGTLDTLTHTLMHTRTHMHTYTRAHPYTFKRTHMHTHIHTCTHIRTCAQMRTCMHTNMHRHTHSHTHTRTHTHTHLRAFIRRRGSQEEHPNSGNPAHSQGPRIFLMRVGCFGSLSNAQVILPSGCRRG
jgi:hypothetical protein